LRPLRFSPFFSEDGEDPMSTVPRRHRFTIEEYYHVARSGLVPATRTELIDGAIFDMTPQGAWHVECVRSLAESFVRGVRTGERVYVQSTTRLSRWSAPEPDIVVAREGSERWALPRPGDILLIIEVADTTLTYDLGTKVPLYEQHGIPEVWVVDLQGRQVHAFRQREPGHPYGPARLVSPPSQLSACGATIEVGSLFP
jgi:Uma2 family endonuclease